MTTESHGSLFGPRDGCLYLLTYPQERFSSVPDKVWKCETLLSLTRRHTARQSDGPYRKSYKISNITSLKISGRFAPLFLDTEGN